MMLTDFSTEQASEYVKFFRNTIFPGETSQTTSNKYIAKFDFRKSMAKSIAND